jgi:stage V sporulation protein AD
MQKGWIPTHCGILAAAGVVGKLEKKGPLGGCFDLHSEDDRFAQKTWEKAEAEMQRLALNTAIGKWGGAEADLEAIFAGDLLNQNIASTFGLREMNVPLIGQFGACSTMGQTMAMAAIFVDSGAADLCGAVTSSHFCTAERQFRYPLEYGGQRPPTSQWTATASGAVVVGRAARGVRISEVCIGRVQDMGVTDMNNMGSAMAPAAADTLARFFADTQTKPADYDQIVTGDLGLVGARLCRELLEQKGYTLGDNYTDCGLLLFDRHSQDVHAGGSGCGCSASVLCAHWLPMLESGKLRNLLFCPTGALMSPTSSQQGESIPSICHALLLESCS